MLKTCIALILVCLVCNSVIASSAAKHTAMSANAIDDAAAKVKKTVAKIGTGPKAKVTVQLLDDKKVKGYITSAGDDLFTVTDEAGLDTKIRYDQVKFLSRRGLGVGSWIAIGALAGAA